MKQSRPATVYRGVCIDSEDPEGKGRIRIQIPQILGENVSGWAFPAWPVGDLGIHHRDRQPSPGQGVWVIFESWDHLSWFGVFGEVVELPEDDIGNYRTYLTISVPVMPRDAPVEIEGTLESYGASVPGPGAKVRVEAAQTATGPWKRLGTTEVGPWDGGRWTFLFSPSAPVDHKWYRAVFDGAPPYAASVSEPQEPSDPPNPSMLSWSAYSPEWGVPAATSGRLRFMAADGEEPIPDALVLLHRRIPPTGRWERIAEARTGLDGKWTATWTRPDPGMCELRASYGGSKEFRPTEEVQTIPAMQIPLDVALSVSVPDPSPGAALTAEATASCRFPLPDPLVVVVEQQVPGGDWAPVAEVRTNSPGPSPARVPASALLTEAVSSYRAVVPASGHYLESVSGPVALDLVSGTRTEPPMVDRAYRGAEASLSGRILREGSSSPAIAGSVVGYWRLPGEESWTNCTKSSSGPLKYGDYTVVTDPLPAMGPMEFKVEYLGDGNFYLPCESPASQATVGVPVVYGLRGTGQSHTSSAIAWTSAGPGVSYEVQRRTNGGAWSRRIITDKTTYEESGLSNSTSYGYRARAVIGTFNGEWSPVITLATGNPVVRRTMAKTEYKASPTSTGTYRSGVWIGPTVVQSRWTGGSLSSAYGLMTYSADAFQAWLRNNYGQAVLDHVRWNPDTFRAVSIRMSRKPDSGNGSGAIRMAWWVTRDVPWGTPNNTPPQMAGGGELSAATVPLSGAAWCDVPSEWWAKHVLFREMDAWNKGGYASFAVHTGDTGMYSQFYGLGEQASACEISVELAWDFIETAAVAPSWS